MPLNLPLLPNQPIVDSNGVPSIIFQQYWQQVVGQIQTSINGIQAALDAAAAAQETANTAQSTAEDAQTTANAAQDTANDAITAANGQSLVTSGIRPNPVITCNNSTIFIADHTRFYGDGTSVAVDGGSLPIVDPDLPNYVFYSDPTHSGGHVSYQASVDPQTQTGSTHLVGSVTPPATGTITGNPGPYPPGGS